MTQNAPFPVKASVAADEIPAIAPADQLEEHDEDRHIEYGARPEQRLRQRIAEEADVGKDEHKAVESCLLRLQTQKLRQQEAQRDRHSVRGNGRPTGESSGLGPLKKRQG